MNCTVTVICAWLEDLAAQTGITRDYGDTLLNPQTPSAPEPLGYETRSRRASSAPSRKTAFLHPPACVMPVPTALSHGPPCAAAIPHRPA